jgi:hypothetical protein
VTRVSKLSTTSRNCFTSSADAGAELLACARPAGHHTTSARHIPTMQRSEFLKISVGPLCEVCLIMRRLLSRLVSTISSRGTAPDL